MRSGQIKKPSGFQADLVCLTPWVNGEAPSQISCLTVNSNFGLLSYGNGSGNNFVTNISLLSSTLNILHIGNLYYELNITSINTKILQKVIYFGDNTLYKNFFKLEPKYFVGHFVRSGDSGLYTTQMSSEHGHSRSVW